jgi:hypothetical protein
MNIPATKRLLQKEILTIVNKMKVVVPQIPDEGFKKTQEQKLKDIQLKYEGCNANHEELKKLLIMTKSNVFNLHLKYPSLKPVYDQAEGYKFDKVPEQEKDIFSESNEYELRKKQAELRLKKLQNYEVNNPDDDVLEEDNTQLKKDFIRKLSVLSLCISQVV